jgi:hypothetical protein
MPKSLAVLVAVPVSYSVLKMSKDFRELRFISLIFSDLEGGWLDENMSLSHEIMNKHYVLKLICSCSLMTED